jgi:carbonic anhydrase
VLASLEELERPSGSHSPNLGFIVNSIVPNVAPLYPAGGAGDRASLVRRAVRANIRASAEHLRPRGAGGLPATKAACFSAIT